MHFERKAIRKIERFEQKAEKWVRRHLLLSIVALLLGILTLRGVVGAMRVGEPFSIKQIAVSAVTSSIDMDRYNHTNILLLGMGGAGHDGAHLTDTIIVASIDHKQNLVPMLSIPRDFYVENDYLGYGTRINSVYELILDKSEDHDFAIGQIMKEVSETLDVELHYYAMIDFSGFEDVIDAMGGVEITLDEAFYDPYYPVPDGTEGDFQEFHLPAGSQTLSGPQALKYVRSRKTTSDFDRARRQQEILAAIKDRASSAGFLLSAGKIKDTWQVINAHFQTNLDLGELTFLAAQANDFGSDSVLTQVLNDEPYRAGGFLYTPEREDFGGAFILTPYAGDNSELQTFAQLYLYNPELYVDSTPLQILNGTKEEGLAGLTKMYLARYGFNVVRYGNAFDQDQEQSVVFPNRELDELGEETLDFLNPLIFAKELKEAPEIYSLDNFDTEASILILLGQDFADFYREHDELFYVGFY